MSERLPHLETRYHPCAWKWKWRRREADGSNRGWRARRSLCAHQCVKGSQEKTVGRKSILRLCSSGKLWQHIAFFCRVNWLSRSKTGRQTVTPRCTDHVVNTSSAATTTLCRHIFMQPHTLRLTLVCLSSGICRNCLETKHIFEF